MIIAIFDCKKTVTIDDELVRVYETCRPKVDIKNIEFLLAGDGIKDNTILSNDELSNQVTKDMREELKVVHDIEFGGKKEEAFIAYANMKRA